MGLDTSHDCWHGAYSAFMRWRKKLAEVAGLPPLDLMEGFFPMGHHYAFAGCEDQEWYQCLPIKWDALRPDVLHVLLDHSDCDGWIPAIYCGPLADRLAELLPLLPDGDDPGHIGNWRAKTQQFINGLREAHEAGQDVDFH